MRFTTKVYFSAKFCESWMIKIIIIYLCDRGTESIEKIVSVCESEWMCMWNMLILWHCILHHSKCWFLTDSKTKKKNKKKRQNESNSNFAYIGFLLKLISFRTRLACHQNRTGEKKEERHILLRVRLCECVLCAHTEIYAKRVTDLLIFYYKMCAYGMWWNMNFLIDGGHYWWLHNKAIGLGMVWTAFRVHLSCTCKYFPIGRVGCLQYILYVNQYEKKN